MQDDRIVGLSRGRQREARAPVGPMRLPGVSVPPCAHRILQVHGSVGYVSSHRQCQCDPVGARTQSHFEPDGSFYLGAMRRDPTTVARFWLLESDAKLFSDGSSTLPRPAVPQRALCDRWGRKDHRPAAVVRAK